MAYSPVPLASFESGDPDGLPVLLLHGFPLDNTQWAEQQRIQVGARLIAVDLRGFGSSYFDEPASIEEMARDVLALADSLDARRFAVVGSSMGGYVALALSRLAPERVAGLVLTDTRADADSPERKRARDESIARIRSDGVQVLGEAMMPKFFTERTLEERPQIVRETLRTMHSVSPQGAINALTAMRDRPDLTGHLGSIRCPTLIITGEHDTLAPPDLAEAMASRIPGAKLVVIPGAAHLSNLENPDAFNRALADFLRPLLREGAGGVPRRAAGPRDTRVP